MKVLLVGSAGSMGTRYQSILKYIDVPFVPVDKHTTSEEIFRAAEGCDRIILATPTDIHLRCLEIFHRYKVPILCEKPLSKDINELVAIKDLVLSEKIKLRMVMQYEMLIDPRSHGDSWYNYFRHGSDGLAWDCLQIIGLARFGSKITLEETSPIWTCGINGKTISFSDMDQAYVRFIRHWLEFPLDDISRLYDIHMKVMEYGQKH